MEKIKNKKGSILAYSLVVMFVVLIILTSMMTYISSQLKFSSNREEREKAFQVAEAGIYFYKWYLAHETSGKTAQQLATFWEGAGVIGKTPYTRDYEGIGEFTLELVETPASGSTIVKVKSTGSTYRLPSVERTVQVHFRRPSWSEYIFLVDDFINFGTEAEVFGKVHSNYGIRFDGVAHNVVSSLVPSFNDPTHGGSNEFGVHTHVNPIDPLAPAYPWSEGTVPVRNDVFMAGREFPVAEVSFNGVVTDLAAMKTEAQSGDGDYYNNAGKGRRIILKADGTYDVCTVDTYHSTSFSITRYLRTSGSGTCNSCSGLCLSNHPIPDDSVIFVEDNAWVEGTINNKRVTITAANLLGGTTANIFIGINNIRYTNYDGRDVIGLVAQNDITIIRDCPSVFTTDAALIAQSGRIGRGDHGFSSKDKLVFNGALASYNQPYFNHGVSGFGEREYNFDNNLLYWPPPFFPTGTEYFVDLWEEI